MKGVGMLPMNGGTGDRSYANNSSLQKEVICMTWRVIKKAIKDLYCRTSPKIMSIADLGCSSGPNTLMLLSNLIKQIEDIRVQLGHNNPLEYQLLLNDLPENDFNAIFSAIPSFLKTLKTQMKPDFGQCFFTGVPGSFYGRIFPSKSVDFIHSSYGLHWLSQVPEGLASNKRNIYITSSSPESVLEAYYKQFQKDFSTFLKYRAQEVKNGGAMVLTLLGRTIEARSSKECCYTWELLALALNHMIKKGRVEEEKLNSFNMPIYMPSPLELEVEVLNEGSFTINCLHISRLEWSFFNKEFNPSTTLLQNCQSVAEGIRAVAEPFIARHFGEAIVDELFNIFKDILVDRMSRERPEYTNLTIYLTKTK